MQNEEELKAAEMEVQQAREALLSCEMQVGTLQAGISTGDDLLDALDAKEKLEMADLLQQENLRKGRRKLFKELAQKEKEAKRAQNVLNEAEARLLKAQRVQARKACDHEVHDLALLAEQIEDRIREQIEAHRGGSVAEVERLKPAGTLSRTTTPFSEVLSANTALEGLGAALRQYRASQKQQRMNEHMARAEAMRPLPHESDRSGTTPPAPGYVGFAERDDARLEAWADEPEAQA